MTKIETEDLYQIALLIDQLKHDDVQLRINASKNLIRIANALGPERTREELIPFLTESTDDEDEVLLAIAEKLGEMAACVGGSEHVHLLLTPLEQLVAVEESSVREVSTKSISLIVESMSNSQIESYYAPFVSRLATKDWFTSRVSAAALFHLGYSRLPETEKHKFRHLFLNLCTDDTAMVRRVAAQYFGNFVGQIKQAEAMTDFVAPFESLSRDDQDSVRIQTICSCKKLVEVLPADISKSKVLPIVISATSDRSWRVRWSLAIQLHEICSAFGSAVTNSSLVAVFENLLGDVEAEVRAAMGSKIALVCKYIRKDVVTSKIFPIFHRLVADSSEHVRASLATVISDLAAVLGKEDTVEHLLPILLLFLRDETSEVRLNIISNLEKINSVIGVELLSQSLLPAIVELAEDSKWRVRTAIIEHMPMLALRLGSEFFNEKLSSLYVTWLSDGVYSVRRTAAEQLPNLAAQFGEEWTRQQIIPHIDRMHVHSSYLHRMTALYAVQSLLPKLSDATIEKTIMPVLATTTDDHVANVRFTTAKLLRQVLGQVARDRISSASVVNEANRLLEKLATDDDRDVRFHTKIVGAI